MNADEQLRQYLANGDMAATNPDMVAWRKPEHTVIVQNGEVVKRTKRSHKYNAQAVEVDGVRFDSKKEAQRYQELQMLAAADEIYALQLQPRFELQPKFKHNGKTIRAIHYVADFQYIENATDILIVEDTKGMETAVFKLKKKLFLFKYPNIELRII